MQTTTTVEEKIREAAQRYTGGAPQLKTIAKYINENSNYIANVTQESRGQSRFDRSGRRRMMHTSTREHTVNILEVWFIDAGGQRHLVFDHESGTPFRTNNGVCRWVVGHVK